MNCLFQGEEIDNGFFNILQSDHHFEDLDIDDKVMNTVDKAMEQYADVRLAMKSESNQCSQIDNNFGINSDKDLVELNQELKYISLFEDNAIDTNLFINDSLVAKKESFNASVDPTTKITKNATSKLDDTNVADKPKIDNDKRKTQKKDNEEIKTRTNRQNAKKSSL